MDDELIRRISEKLKESEPKTQQTCCRIAADIGVALFGIPQDDDEFFNIAFDLAAGLFGEAFLSADDDQRATWVNMCLTELRKAAEEAGRQ